MEFKFVIVLYYFVNIIANYVVTNQSEIYLTPEASRNFIYNNKNYSPKIRMTKSRVQYYSNHTATFQLLLSGDIQVNPRPVLRSGDKTTKSEVNKTVKPTCTICDKTIRSNQKHILCENCFETNHASCLNKTHLVSNGRIPLVTTCDNCLLSILPFYCTRELTCNNSFTNLLVDENILSDQHKQNFNENLNLLKLMHLNAQSLSSTFDAFQHLIHDYPFDIACITETWLTGNKH